MAKLIINPVYAYLYRWTRNLPEVFKKGEGEIVNDGRNTIRRFKVENINIIVKRFKVPMLHQRIDYTFFRPSKARRAYEYAFKFKKKGIPTPDPVAYMETKCCGLFHTGYFLSIEVPGTELRTIMESGNGTPGMVDAVTHTLAKMHNCGIWHGDLNLTNFIGQDQGNDEWMINMVDNNRTRFPHRSLTMDERARNLCRLTHVRPLFKQLVGEYARLENYDVEAFTNLAIHYLDNFEK